MPLICAICRDCLRGQNALSVSTRTAVTVTVTSGEMDYVVATNCGHLYHNSCLTTWFGVERGRNGVGSHYSCPICKSTIRHNCIRIFPIEAEYAEDDAGMSPSIPRASSSRQQSASAPAPAPAPVCAQSNQDDLIADLNRMVIFLENQKENVRDMLVQVRGRLIQAAAASVIRLRRQVSVSGAEPMASGLEIPLLNIELQSYC